ncbi:hypothetical protein OJ996_08595 [Luteolibacter sp. GHJ8]|uniref:Antitoxin VbhA domain-containing protein n=1 Tax=Luteolibacter rhizosphaerae TaxID=2989719 RepID=A0ABT3G1C5_9BACT|nr:hypothetical protein [Luteolibacter rhizosphaerae]MCW1913631.1 hypothetical protein [Luteolibacter rhizosphaerae]
MITEDWYASNLGKIEALLSNSEPGPSRDRFLATLAARSHQFGDQKGEAYLNQIESEAIRREASSRIGIGE